MLFVPHLVKYLKTPPGDSKNRANSRNFIWPPGGGLKSTPPRKKWSKTVKLIKFEGILLLFLAFSWVPNFVDILTPTTLVQ